MRETVEIAKSIIKEITEQEDSNLMVSCTFKHVLRDIIGISFSKKLKKIKKNTLKLLEKGFDNPKKQLNDNSWAFKKNNTLYLVKHNQRFDYVVIFEENGGGFMKDQPMVHIRKFYIETEKDNYDISEIKKIAQLLVDNPNDNQLLMQMNRITYNTTPDGLHCLSFEDVQTKGIRFKDSRDPGYIATFYSEKLEHELYDKDLLEYVFTDMSLTFD